VRTIKFTSDATLGISLILFAYIYWTIYRIEIGSVTSWTSGEILNVTVNLFYIALLVSLVSVVFRGVVIKQQESHNKWNWLLLVVAMIPFSKWLIETIAYVGS
jgi:hypothetical protein